MTTWVGVKGYEGLYQISSDGRCRSVGRTVQAAKGATKRLTGKVLTPKRQKSGHLSVCLSKKGEVKQHLLHRLVGFHFVDGYFEGACIRHLDGNTNNNRAENLRWGTVRENSNDMYIRHGKRVGKSSHFCRHSEATINHALLLKGEMSSNDAAKLTGVSRRYISRLWRGEAAFQRAKNEVLRWEG